MITMGCDVGSLFSKAVILDGQELLASEIIETTGNIADEMDRLLASVVSQASLQDSDIERLVSTGAGAEFVNSAEFTEDVVGCVGLAAKRYIPEIRRAIDIGGQSITALLVDDEEEVVDFMRNDKCASGSGRFLEVMSNALGIEVAMIDQTVAEAKKPVLISSQCGVFAESEVITHVNEGEDRADIIAGICDAVAKMVIAQARRFGLNEDYTLTGGVAKIRTVVNLIREGLAPPYREFPHNPQLAAALGAALFAGET